MGLPCALVANMRYGCWKSKEKNERSEVCWLLRLGATYCVTLRNQPNLRVSVMIALLTAHCMLVEQKTRVAADLLCFRPISISPSAHFFPLVSTITFDLRQTFQAGTFFIWRSIPRKIGQLDIQIMGYEDYLSRWPKTRFQPKTAPRFAQYLLIGTTKSMHKRSNIPTPVAEFSDKKRMYGKDQF